LRRSCKLLYCSWLAVTSVVKPNKWSVSYTYTWCMNIFYLRGITKRMRYHHYFDCMFFLQTNFNFFFSIWQWIHFPSNYSGGRWDEGYVAFSFPFINGGAFCCSAFSTKSPGVTFDILLKAIGYSHFWNSEDACICGGFTDWYWQILSHAHATWEDVLVRLKVQKPHKYLDDIALFDFIAQASPGTLPETNISPENGWLEDEFPLEIIPFSGTC